MYENKRIDKLTAKHTACKTLADLADLAIDGNYVPTIANHELADWFDLAMKARRSDIRAWRGSKR